MSKSKAAVGDWVRFYQDMKMVIGVIQYVGEDEIGGDVYFDTDVGRIKEKYVLERRGA